MSQEKADASVGLAGKISAKDDDVKEVDEADKPRLAVNSESERGRFGWKKVSELAEIRTNKKFQYDEILKELYYSDLWLYSGVVFVSLFTTWFIVLCGGSFGWIVVLCAFIATYLKNSVTRFYRNALSDIGRKIAKERLEGEDERVEWLNEFLRRFWLIYEPVLSASIVQVADSVLAASTPGFLDSLKLTTFTLGTKPPIIESVRSYPKTDDDEVVMDWRISFVPNDLADMTKAQLAKKINPKVILNIRVGRGIVGAGMPVLVEDMTFTGLMRVKLKLIPNFPHIETIDLSFIEEPVISYVLKPVGGETFGLDINKIVPGLSKFLRDQMHASLRPMIYSPNVYTLVTDYLLNGFPVVSSIGVLKLTFKDAKSLRNAETFGTSDPYCKVILQSSDATITGKESTRTKYIKNSLNPVWNETKYLLLNNLNDTLKFKIMDYNGPFSTDTVLGDNAFSLESLIKKPDQSNSTIPVIHDEKEKGELDFDAVWYPVAKAKAKEPVPESNIGILKFNIHQAEELDVKFSMAGLNHPYAELMFNEKQVFRTKTHRRTNAPTWEEFFEIFVTNRKEAKLSLIIRDERDFAEDPIVGSWSMSVDEFLERLNGKIDWFDLKNARSGKVRLSCQWKPVVILDHIPESSGYAEPLGIAKLHIKKATDLKNVERLKGKSDSYVRITLETIYRGRTDVRNDNLNPIWDEYFYIPIHSLKEKLYLQCFDRENHGKDRALGFTELAVKDLIKESDDGNISPELTDKAAPLVVGNNKKGTLFYSASFHPVLRSDEKREINEENNNLLKYKSGILAVNVVKANFKEKNTYVEVLVGNDRFPAYITHVSETPEPYWSEVADIFIKELDSSKITFNINHSSKSIGKVVSNVKELLDKHSKDDKDIWLPIEGVDHCSLNIKLNYIPVKYDDGLNENNSNMDHLENLQITLVNAENLPSTNHSATIDPYVKFVLNDKYIFESKVLKKTLNPEYNEDFSVSVPSRTSKFFVKVYDHASTKLIASGEIPLENAKSTQKISLKNELDPNNKLNSFITLSIIFHPENLNKKEQPTAAIASATRTLNDLGGGLSKISTGFGLLKKKGKDDKKKSKEEEDTPVEEPKIEEVIQHKLEEIKKEKPDTEAITEPKAEEVIHKAEVAPKVEETKSINEVNANQGPKPRENSNGTITNYMKVPQEEKQKQVEEVNSNIDFKQEEENNVNKSLTTRHVGLEKKQDEGSRSSEENEVFGEPGDLTISVIEAKNLMAVSNGGTTSDPYVKVKMNGNKDILKTHVVKKSTSPKWGEQKTLTGLTDSPVSFLFYVQDRNLLSKNVYLGEYELSLWDHIKPGEYTKDIWVPLSKAKGTDSQLHIKLNFIPSTQRKSTSERQVNGNNSGSKSIFRKLSGDSDRDVNVHGNGKGSISKFSIRRKKN